MLARVVSLSSPSASLLMLNANAPSGALCGAVAQEP
jgi:hypothetical protein